jgi:hypothetical protein
MSGWTDYVIADKEDAAAIAKNINPKNKWSGIEGYKWMGPTLLLPLCQALEKEDAGFSDFPELARSRRAFVYELPPAMTEGLLAADDDRLEDVAEGWRERLATMNAEYSAEELHSLLKEIRDLLKKAREAGKPVLLWASTSS